MQGAKTFLKAGKSLKQGKWGEVLHNWEAYAQQNMISMARYAQQGSSALLFV